MSDVRATLIRTVRRMYERHLTDTAGGNVSARDGDSIFITPRLSGAKRQWSISEEDLIELSYSNPDPNADSRLSREVKVHLALYRDLPLCGSVIHAHPQHVQVFVSAGKPIPPATEQTDKFGVIGFVDPAPPHSVDLASNVAAGLKPKAHMLEKHGAAVLAPRHGIFVVGRDLDDAYDTLERIDNSARYNLLSKLLVDA
ncbi:MAG TPA: class II aldolase/adducin family protein [Armatimonadota bacterium]|jgi:L-fuculose-phosphate aldolase